MEQFCRRLDLVFATLWELGLLVGVSLPGTCALKPRLVHQRQGILPPLGDGDSFFYGMERICS